MQIITTHKNTDFDGLASVIAASVLYPDAVPVVPKNVNPNVKSFLSIHKDVFTLSFPNEIDLEKVKSLIVVDINRWSRLEGMKRLQHRDDLEVILWDHHPDKGDISANQSCQEPMGANITLMLRQIRLEDRSLTPIQSTLFLAGIHEDTGNLMFPSTRSEDALAAAFLMEQGADLNFLGSLLRPAYGEKQKSILFEMLQQGDRRQINGYSISFSKIHIEGHVESLAIVVQMCQEIMNVDAVFGIFTGKKRAKSIIIGRSSADGLDVGAIMRSLGGGGHPGAGSCLLNFVNPDSIVEMIADLIEGNQQASVRVGDLMSFPVFSVPADTPMKDVGMILRDKGCTGVPVVEDSRLVGIISRRDFKKLRKKSAENAPVKAFMNVNVLTITSDRSPMHAAQLMVKYDIGRLPVIQDGEIIGIITRSDMMRYFYDLLPD